MRRSLATHLLSLAAVALVGAPAVAQQTDISTAEVNVLDPGAEPRQALRYEFVEGSTEVLESVIDNAIVVRINGAPTESLELSMTMTTTTTVTEVFDDGSARVDYVITDWDFGDMGGMTPDPAELDAALGIVEGLGGYWILDTRGAVLDFGLDLPAGIPAELSSQVDGAIIEVEALPEEPVGVGAIWETFTRTASGGVDMGMIQTTEITSIEGDVIGLRQAFVSDSDSAGSGLLPMEIELTGSGVSELRLDRVSQPAELETMVTSSLSFEDGSGTTDIVTDTTTNVVATLVE